MHPGVQLAMLAGLGKLVYRRLLRPCAGLLALTGGGYLLYMMATALKQTTTADGRREGMMNAMTDQ